MLYVGSGHCKIDHYTYDGYRCEDCEKSEIRNKKYKPTYDMEGGLSD